MGMIPKTDKCSIIYPSKWPQSYKTSNISRLKFSIKFIEWCELLQVFWKKWSKLLYIQFLDISMYQQKWSYNQNWSHIYKTFVRIVRKNRPQVEGRKRKRKREKTRKGKRKGKSEGEKWREGEDKTGRDGGRKREKERKTKMERQNVFHAKFIFSFTFNCFTT